MLVLLIVLGIVVVLALLIGLGGFGGYGGGYAGGPTVYRRIIYRRPSRRVVTEHRVVDDLDPPDRPVYRR